jgi:Glycosyl hydrolase family 59
VDRLHRTSVTINGARPGRVFQGVGAISGGGGNSRLLIDYPPAQRQQILDYLFKPGYGADLQILKIEIGGDAYATDGAEPSFEHTKGHTDCAAGYEMWIAQQARKLDPAIQIYGLQWNGPGWTGTFKNPWTTADIGYLVDWLHCASKEGLRINYLGGWNEHLGRGISDKILGWFVRLRSALDRAGYGRVKLVATDSFAHRHDNDVSDYLAHHPAFRRAVSVLGYHNLCRYPATGNNCRVPRAAIRSGKPIWESEIGALKEGKGTGAMARSLVNAFVEVKATGLLEWPLVSSMPANLPEEDRGLIFADEPWSGQFHVNLMSWILAQTTEFTRPGWRHVRGSSGTFGGEYGSFTSYEAPDHAAWSLVTQTTQAKARQEIVVHVDRGLPDSVVRVWSTNLGSRHTRGWFVHIANLHPSHRTFSFVLRPKFIYTFTTTTGQHKGHAGSPRSRPMPLPYRATRDGSNEPRYLGAEDGAFEYLPDSSTTFAQTAVGRPNFWQNPVRSRFPYAVVGWRNWANYTVSVSVRFTGAGQSGGLIARFRHAKANGIAQQFHGYQFIVSESGAWRLTRNAIGAAPATLESGQAGALGTAVFHNLSLAAHGSQLVARLDGTTVATVSDPTYNGGDAGVSTGGWYQVQFRGLTVTG